MQDITLNWKTLGILTVVSWGLSRLLGEDSTIAVVLELLAIILFFITIVTGFKAWRNSKKVINQ